MKHLKMLGLLVTAAAALMAFAAPASANPVLTSPKGVEYTGEINATLKSGTSALLQAGFANITCTESTVTGTVTENNTSHAQGSISTLSFTGGSTCVTNTIKTGSLTIASGGEVTGSGSEVTVERFGTSCVYGTGAGTSLGTLKGGTPATLSISASLPRISGGFGCSNPATWTANYVVTTPGTLLVD